ncbi:MAG: c-type cytochrome [Acidimicrobiia bacterium]|nr:c-type cytochrome [Acidimicrobiia bacterium]
MKREERAEYLEQYAEDKKKGIPFFPDAVFKDVLVGFLVLLFLIGLAYFGGAPLEERANPSDSDYTPRPEWYFLWLFQLLKYFPGNLEFVGVILLPALGFALLFALPYLDRNRFRHFAKRSWVMASMGVAVVAMGFLTVQSMIDIPLPANVTGEINAAALFTENCSSCHGTSINVSSGTNLHETIAAGHDGMPAFAGSLSTDEIDALAGFVVSPQGGAIFTANCAECHDSGDLAAISPFDLQAALTQGTSYPAHAELDIPEWDEVVFGPDRTALLNFLLAPDGQRLYTLYCAECHGSSIDWEGDRAQLEILIREGGNHLEMTQWRDVLPEDAITELAVYVTTPAASPNGANLFSQHCAECHSARVPSAPDLETAYAIIAEGAEHRSMPLWGDVLTEEQLTALTTYTLEASRGTPILIGQELFGRLCSSCHGDFGEGGPHPSDPTNVIAPISTALYLETRDDATLRAIISRGQSDQGMSPFLDSEGGPLTKDEIEALVAFLRSWEDDPPVDFPPDLARGPVAGGSAQVFSAFCAQCHGEDGAGGSGLVGPTLTSAEFHDSFTDQSLYDAIDRGHAATSMIAWGEVLTADQINGLVEHIRTLGGRGASLTIVYARDIAPIFQSSCGGCHGSSGGWDASTMATVIESGDSGPAVIAGDPEASNLVKRLHGDGNLMPPSAALPTSQIELIEQWIAGGATAEVTLGDGSAGDVDAADLTWTAHVQPILATSCSACHGSAGGWDAATYDSTLNSGNSGPAVVPGDADNSALAQRLQGNGALMPPGNALTNEQIQLIINWINNGAPE